MKCTNLLLCKLIVSYVTDHNVYMSIPVTGKELFQSLFLKKIIKVDFLLETNFLLGYPQKLQ